LNLPTYNLFSFPEGGDMSKTDNFKDLNDVLNTPNIPSFISFGSAKIAYGENS